MSFAFWREGFWGHLSQLEGEDFNVHIKYYGRPADPDDPPIPSMLVASSVLVRVRL